MKRLAVLLCLLLAACTVVHSGVVESKSYSPPYWQNTLYACGKSMCTMLQYIPEHWDLWVCEPKSDIYEVEDKRRCSWWGVNQEYYNTIEVGDLVDDGKEG